MDAYRHLLLAVDLHDECRQVAHRGLAIARWAGAGLTLLHVVENVPVEPGNELMIPATTAVEAELMENAQRRLDALGDDFGIPPAQRLLRSGQTKREIIAAARECEADLIVVGSHERHGLALLLGSTANSLLHGSPCDVLAVRLRE